MTCRADSIIAAISIPVVVSFRKAETVVHSFGVLRPSYTSFALQAASTCIFNPSPTCNRTAQYWACLYLTSLAYIVLQSLK